MHVRKWFALATVLLVVSIAGSQAAFFGAASSFAATTPSSISDTIKLAEKPIQALSRLAKDTGGKVQVSISTATNVARFMRFEGNAAAPYALAANTNAAANAQAMAFLNNYGAAFGLRTPANELRMVSNTVDQIGTRRLDYEQVVGGVPVFAGLLRIHFTAAGALSAVNGTIIPDVRPQTATLSQGAAEQIALRSVTGNSADALRPTNTRLVMYRSNLAQGIPGANTLAYVTQVTNGVDLREFIAVDAVTGKIVDHYSLVEQALKRKVYEKEYSPAALVWQEGNAFPGKLNSDQRNIVEGTGEAYHLFFNTFGRDSYDGAGATMETVNNDPRIECPNANWNGITTNYCNGVTGDDTVAHEWGHAYTEYTHNLIYQWQPGALNESYSDIWGEVVDIVNNRGKEKDADAPRIAGVCSKYSPAQLLFRIQQPASIAGDYAAILAAFGPSSCDVTKQVALANDDAEGTTHLACTPIANASAIAGKIALIDRGACNFTVKVKNAQKAGAAAVLVANNSPTGLPGMSGSDGTITIPSAGITQDAGQKIRDALSAGDAVTVKLSTKEAVAQNSYRWLSGEDDPAFGGAIRDMWLPSCYANPNKVTDVAYYTCDGNSDNGGVHTNSGVPNHAFALTVDGGTFNGQTIVGLGLVKAAHIYWRAQSEYQVQNSYFADHADALEQSCTDLIGINLQGISVTTTSAGLSGQSITAADCGELGKAIAAVELRSEPTQCAFAALLNPAAPPLCEGANHPIFEDTFEGDVSNWTVSHTDVYSTTQIDWVRTNTLPDNREGSAFYAFDGQAGNCSSDIGDASRVMNLTSPQIALPASITSVQLAFDHYVATEASYDGGNLQVSVNGGDFVQVEPDDFIFNGYNSTLATKDEGNTNPLQGQDAFTGTDGGRVEGSWGQSQVNLAKYAKGGDTVQLRYRFGADGCGGVDGWYIDNVKVYSCDVAFYDDSLQSLSISEGTLTPAFNPDTLAYTTVVSDGVTSISVTATTHSPDATLTINGVTVPSGTTSVPIALTAGANTIVVTVKSASGSTKSYQIAVTRSVVISTDTNVYLPVVRR